MANKLSSPSSSSNGGSNQTPPKNGPGGMLSRDDDNYLVVRRQPPAYVFVDEPFEILVGLEVTRLTGDSPTGTEVELTASLKWQCSGSSAAQDIVGSVVLLSDSGNTVSTTKPCRLRCKIQMRESPRRDKRVSCLLSISTREPRLHGIASTTTTVIQVVNYKLRIAIDSNWSNVWYKDEGGRDKSMEVVAELYSQDNIQHRERVPLRLTLLYGPSSEGLNPVKVTNQEVLRSLGNSSKLYTDKSTGKASIRFRIEDVSKNHQGQDFVLEIAPDYRKGFLDVAPGLTPSVSVRSKRNKRQRSSTTGGRAERQGPSPVEHGQSSSGGRSFGEHPARSVWGQESVTTTDPARLREAMQGIVHWTEEVVNGLYPLQWQILGYAQHPDGSPDYSRPHYSMTNPNACISRVLAMYAESTRENLWVLSQAVEQAANSQIQSGNPEGLQPGNREGLQPGNREGYGRRSPDNSYSVTLAHRGPPPQPPPLPPPAHATGHPPPGLTPPPQATRGGISVASGMHPSIASEAFRPKMILGDPHLHLHHHNQLPQPQQHHGGLMPFASPAGRGRPLPSQHAMPQQYYRRPLPAQPRRGMDDADANLLPEPFPPPTMRAMGDSGSPPSHGDASNRMAQPPYEEHANANDLQSRESEVEFVLAKEYKALRTGERLGFPAYSSSREIVGFYSESRTKVGVGVFLPISSHAQDFGPLEIMQASEILEEAIAKKSSAVHAMKDWGTIANLIDHALVYDWTKDISSSGGTGNSNSGSEGE